MEFTVKAVGEAKEKSVQEVEQELLEKHESSFNESKIKEEICVLKKQSAKDFSLDFLRNS